MGSHEDLNWTHLSSMLRPIGHRRARRCKFKICWYRGGELMATALDGVRDPQLSGARRGVRIAKERGPS